MKDRSCGAAVSALLAGIAVWATRLVLAAGAAFFSATFAAVAVAIADLYVTGHGGASLRQPWLNWSPFVEVSAGDVIVLAAATLGGATTIIALTCFDPRPRSILRWR